MQQTADYRDFLLREFDKRRARNAFYSLRAYARDLELSPSRLSEVLNRKKGLSMAVAQDVSRKLGLDAITEKTFVLSVQANHARSKAEKKNASQLLEQHLKAKKESPLKTETIVNWVTEAILKMSQRRGESIEVDVLAKKLSVPKFSIIDSMRFLRRLGFISAEKGKAYLSHRGEGRRLNVDYEQILEQARKSLLTQGKNFQHEAFLLEEKNIEQAQQLINKCFAEIKELESKSKKSRFYFLSTQLFSPEEK